MPGHRPLARQLVTTLLASCSLCFENSSSRAIMSISGDRIGPGLSLLAQGFHGRDASCRQHAQVMEDLVRRQNKRVLSSAYAVRVRMWH